MSIVGVSSFSSDDDDESSSSNMSMTSGSFGSDMFAMMYAANHTCPLMIGGVASVARSLNTLWCLGRDLCLTIEREEAAGGWRFFEF